MLRPAQLQDAPAIARVHVDTWRTNYAGIIPDDFLANLSYERCQAGWREVLSDPQSDTHVFVMEAQAGRVIGFASGGPIREAMEGFDGELYNLYVLKAFQGLGYGKELVAQVRRDLVERGYHAMLLWVLKDNPACRFYEKLGGLRLAEKIVEVGGKKLTDVAYGWSDLAGLNSTKTLYTIGHSAHPMPKFIRLLQAYQIQILVDVRSVPASRFHPQYNKSALQKVLGENQISYVFAGKQLGGRPQDPTCYEPEAQLEKGREHPRANYAEIMQREWFKLGIADLVNQMENGRTAILCSEEDPLHCHRHALIAAYLINAYPSIEVQHIRGDGRLVRAKEFF